MKESFFRSMTWLHTWVGLLVCWLLFLIFFAGTISFFKDEITIWAKPETHNVQHQAQRVQSQAEQIDYVFSQLQQQAPNSLSWRINLPEPRNPVLSYGFAEPKQPGQRRGVAHLPGDGKGVDKDGVGDHFGAALGSALRHDVYRGEDLK